MLHICTKAGVFAPAFFLTGGDMSDNVIPFTGKNGVVEELDLEKEVESALKDVLASLEKEPYEHVIVLLTNCGEIPRIVTSPMLPETATSMLADAQWSLAMLKHSGDV
jgi:hypothetical protein